MWVIWKRPTYRTIFERLWSDLSSEGIIRALDLLALAQLALVSNGQLMPSLSSVSEQIQVMYMAWLKEATKPPS
ncbi:MAG: hypothetical protein WCV92_03875 [Candidatus Buchananbacteria bacterium]